MRARIAGRGSTAVLVLASALPARRHKRRRRLRRARSACISAHKFRLPGEQLQYASHRPGMCQIKPGACEECSTVECRPVFNNSRLMCVVGKENGLPPRELPCPGVVCNVAVLRGQCSRGQHDRILERLATAGCAAFGVGPGSGINPAGRSGIDAEAAEFHGDDVANVVLPPRKRIRIFFFNSWRPHWATCR